MDGTGRRTALESVPHPFAIAVFEDWMFWTDWNHLSIERANKFTGENHTILLNVTQRPMDIHIYHPLKQKKGVDFCYYAKNLNKKNIYLSLFKFYDLLI